MYLMSAITDPFRYCLGFHRKPIYRDLKKYAIYFFFTNEIIDSGAEVKAARVRD